MSLAYYNENDPYCAAWLRNLIVQNLIAPGVVDERSILDVKPYELAPYRQCHFFAGIGGWSYALRLAGVADHREIWTGSCPCQPFSLAGSRRGFADDRDLWPFWKHLIAQRRPATIFGEQVTSAKLWLDRVYADLEAQDFALGAADLPAACVGAKHLRYRTFFVANAVSGELRDEPRWCGRTNGKSPAILTNDGAQRIVAYAPREREREREREQTVESNALTNRRNARAFVSSIGKSLANTNSVTSQRAAIPRPQRDPWSPEPDVGRVVDGVSHKLVEPALRALGNAIVPQVAAQFIKAALG